MDEGIVEARKDVSNTENQFALCDLGTEGNGGFFSNDFSFLGGLLEKKNESSVKLLNMEMDAVCSATGAHPFTTRPSIVFQQSNGSQTPAERLRCSQVDTPHPTLRTYHSVRELRVLTKREVLVDEVSLSTATFRATKVPGATQRQATQNNCKTTPETNKHLATYKNIIKHRDLHKIMERKILY